MDHVLCCRDDVFYRDYGMHFSPHMSHPAPWNHPMMDGGRYNVCMSVSVYVHV